MFDWFWQLCRTDTALDVAHIGMLVLVLFELRALRVVVERSEARTARLQTAAYQSNWKLDRVLRSAATEPSLRRPPVPKDTERFTDGEIEAVLRAAAEVESQPHTPPDLSDSPTTRRPGPLR